MSRRKTCPALLIQAHVGGETVVLQQFEKIQYILRDWNFCQTLQPEIIPHLEVTHDCQPPMYSLSKRTMQQSIVLALDFHCNQLLQPKRMHSSNLKLSIPLWPWPKSTECVCMCVLIIIFYKQKIGQKQSYKVTLHYKCWKQHSILLDNVHQLSG